MYGMYHRDIHYTQANCVFICMTYYHVHVVHVLALQIYHGWFLNKKTLQNNLLWKNNNHILGMQQANMVGNQRKRLERNHLKFKGTFWRKLWLRVHGNLPFLIIGSSTCMEKNVEFGNLIPRKFSWWREIFAILRGNSSFRWIFWSFSYKKFTFLTHFFPALKFNMDLLVFPDHGTWVGCQFPRFYHSSSYTSDIYPGIIVRKSTQNYINDRDG